MRLRLAWMGIGALGSLVGAFSCGDAFQTGPGAGGGSSVGSPCQTVHDCGAPSSPCVNLTCQVGRCTETPRGDGPLTPAAQQEGDCRRLLCSSGELESVVDTSDVPRDGRDCTEDSCDDSGRPVNTSLPIGTPCGEGATTSCDGEGRCIGCSQPSDCGSNGPCVQWTCDDQMCGAQLAPEGTALPAAGQVEGDCKKRVCGPSGEPIDDVDDSDVPEPTPNSCIVLSCGLGEVVQSMVTDGSPCIQSATRVCCLGTCCMEGQTCGASGCQSESGGAGGSGM